MKKQTLKISTVSLLCVLCAGLNTNAMAASSVRTLGGTGTVDGTASAGAATRSAPRAGSLRVMPSSSKSVSSTSADKAASSSKPTSATQRLSIGKYLGGATTTATTGSSSAGSAGSGDNGNLQTRIEQLEDSLGGRISVLEDKDYMTEEEVEAAITAAQLEGADVDLTAYETASEAEAKYQPKGNYLTEHQSLADYETAAQAAEKYQPKGDYLTEHQSLADYETAAQAAEKYQPKGNYLTEHQSLADYATTSAMQEAIAQAKLDGQVDLSAYAKSADLATVATTGSYNDLSNKPEIPSIEGLVTTSAMNTALSGKQDSISDLATIRSGAAAGATAVQPATLNDYAKIIAMNAALEGKQDSISDLATIRSGAAAGATAVQPATLNDYAKTADLADYATTADLEDYATTASLADYATTSAMNTALSGKQDSISDLATIRSGAAAGATAVQPAALDDYATTASLADYATTSAMNTALAGKQDSISDLATIRSGAAAGATAVQPAALNNYATTASLADYMTEDEVAAAIAQAKLDGSDVDLSAYETAAQAAAKYQPKGNYLTEHQSLEGYATTAAMNTALADYATTADLSAYAKSADLATVATTGSYNDLSNKPEIPSIEGLVTTSAMDTALAGYATTASLDDYAKTADLAGYATTTSLDDYAKTADLADYATTASLADYATTAAMNTALAGKQDSISDLATIRSGAAAGATAVQPADLDDYATTADLADYATTASLADYATTSAMNTALSGKQDSISDLATIRSGAAAGATAVQPAALDDYATTAALADYATTASLADYATTSAMDTALSGKQDSISDLATIRSGAAAGATAVQPAALDDYATTASLAGYATTSAMNTALAGKQDSVSDLATIRSGAASGATAVQPAALNDYVAKPTLPSSEGDYMLMLNYDNGTYTYSWNGVAGGTGGGSGSGSGGGSDSGGFSWDDSGW